METSVRYATNRIDEAIKAVSKANRQVHVFFRDDDFEVVEDSLISLLDLFNEYQLPLTGAVIPGTLTNDCTDFLIQRLEQQPLQLIQHGWIHKNHESEGKKHEFGPSRNADEVFADIRSGAETMNKAFGTKWTNVFCPPWNRMTTEGLNSIRRLNFRGISRDAGASPPSPVPEWPVNTDLHTRKTETIDQRIRDGMDDLYTKMTDPETERVGIMLHHKVMIDIDFRIIKYILKAFRDTVVITVEPLVP